MSDEGPKRDDFLKASKDKDNSIVSEFIGFMSDNKKWWLAPILVVLLLLGLLVVLGGSGVAPFIYSLF